MFDNIGQKIKGLSNAIFSILAVLGAACSLIVMLTSEGIMVLIGLLMFVIIPALAWVLSLLLYGFGELIEAQCVTTEILLGIRDSINEKSTVSSADSINEKSTVSDYLVNKNELYEYENSRSSVCQNCNTEQPDHRTTCWKCGANIVE